MEMRIDELATASGIPSRTIRYYNQQGLLPPPRLQGRVGYYDDAHLERLKLVKDLQESRFLPLAVIRSLLRRADQGADLETMLAPLDIVYHQHGDGHELFSKSQLATKAGVGRDVVDAAEKMGLLFGVKHRGAVRYTVDDAAMCGIVKDWMRLGLPAELGHLYRSSLERISREHVLAFNQMVVDPMDWEHTDAADARAQMVAAYREMTEVSNRLIALLQRKLLQYAVEAEAREPSRSASGSRRGA